MKCKSIAGDRWYRQGVEAAPWLVIHAYTGAIDMFGEENAIAFNRGVRNFGYWRLSRQEQIGRETIERQIEHPEYIDDSIREWQKRYIDFNKEYYSQLDHICTLEDEALIQLIQVFHHRAVEMWVPTFIMECFDSQTNPTIEYLLEKYPHTGMTKKIFKECSLLDEPTIPQKEKADLYRIQQIIDKEPQKKEQLFQEHIEQYYWVRTNFYDCEDVTSEFLESEIKHAEPIDESYYETVRERKQEIIRKHAPSEEIQRAIHFFYELTKWREMRKENSMRMNYFLSKVLHEIARRIDQPYKTLVLASTTEVDKLFQNDPEFIMQLKERAKHFCAFKHNGELQILSGEQGMQYIEALESMTSGEDITELHGTPASVGTVEGVVRVLYGQQDFGSFQQDEIIVTFMTRPEFMPLMKKAKAIVTEEGGLTCHAAVVSRELQKPCIVGVQNATSYLKDGMSIQVDGEKGSITIIKQDE